MNKVKTYAITKDTIPGHATHPGVLLHDEIEHRGLMQRELAADLHIAPTILSEIIHGKRNITAELALKLEKALEIDAIVWMRLQVKYDIDSLRIKERNKHQTLSIASEPKTKYGRKR